MVSAKLGEDQIEEHQPFGPGGEALLPGDPRHHRLRVDVRRAPRAARLLARAALSGCIRHNPPALTISALECRHPHPQRRDTAGVNCGGGPDGAAHPVRFVERVATGHDIVMRQRKLRHGKQPRRV